jgi:hypothetical protein
MSPPHLANAWELLHRIRNSGCPIEPFGQFGTRAQFGIDLTFGPIGVVPTFSKAIVALPLRVIVTGPVLFTRCHFEVNGMVDKFSLAQFDAQDQLRSTLAESRLEECFPNICRERLLNLRLFRPIACRQHLAGYLVFETTARLPPVRIGTAVKAELWFADVEQNIYGVSIILFDRTSAADIDDWYAQLASARGLG